MGDFLFYSGTSDFELKHVGHLPSFSPDSGGAANTLGGLTGRSTLHWRKRQGEFSMQTSAKLGHQQLRASFSPMPLEGEPGRVRSLGLANATDQPGNDAGRTKLGSLRG